MPNSVHIIRLVKLLCPGLLLALASGWLQNLHPLFDSLSTFRLHFLVLLALNLLVLVLYRQWKWVLAGLATAIISLYLTIPYLPGFPSSWPPVAKPDNPSAQPALSVVQFNMLFNNQRTRLAINTLSKVNPDFYILQELTDTTRPVLTAIKKTHPYVLDCSTSLSGSVAIAARHPPVPGFQTLCSRKNGLAVARFMVGNDPVTVASLHLAWPWPYSQHRQIDRIQKILPDRHAQPGAFILAGDFNAAPWSHAVQRVAQMTNTRPAAGVVFTWAPRLVEFDINTNPLLPLDQILTRGVRPLQRQRLGDSGGDHFPVKTDLEFSN